MMKHFIYYSLFLSALLLSGCGKDEEYDTGEEYVEVSFSLKEEPAGTSSFSGGAPEKPDLYGIDVLHSDYDETPYAYGLFDDWGMAKVKLRKGERYLFRVMAVPNGKVMCHDEGLGDYLKIFTAHGFVIGEKTPCNNEFRYHDQIHYWWFNNPNESYHYKIYTGYLSDYLAEADGKVEIELKRMYGNIRVTTVNFRHGTLAFRFVSDSSFPFTRSYSPYIYYLTPENPDTRFDYSLRFWGYGHREMPDDYSFTSNYKIGWIDGAGNYQELGEYPVEVKRGEESVVTLDVNELLQNKGY